MVEQRAGGNERWGVARLVVDFEKSLSKHKTQISPHRDAQGSGARCREGGEPRVVPRVPPGDDDTTRWLRVVVVIVREVQDQAGAQAAGSSAGHHHLDRGRRHARVPRETPRAGDGGGPGRGAEQHAHAAHHPNLRRRRGVPGILHLPPRRCVPWSHVTPIIEVPSLVPSIDP